MEVCATPLWDIDITWWTDDPDFTPCFHQTVLVLAPALYILLLSPLQAYLLCVSQARNIPWCVRNTLRMVATAALIAISLLDLGFTLTSQKQLFLSDILSPVANTVGLSMVLIISFINIKRGQHSSGILFGYWALKTICLSFTFSSIIRFGTELGQVISSFAFFHEFSITVGIFFLNFWADPEPSEKSFALQCEKPSPELSSSFPNRLVFSWFGSILKKGWKNPITIAD